MRKLLLLLIFMSCMLVMNAQVSKTLTLGTAGTLLSALSTDELNTVTNLSLSGSIDARDFKTMRDQMPQLSVLDLNGAIIYEYTGSEGTDTESNTYPDNTIPKYAFYKLGVKNTSLTSISISTSVTSIGEAAFGVCTGLDSVSFSSPSSLATIGRDAFGSCTSLTSISIPASVTSIERTAFAFCAKLDSVSFVSPSSLTTIGDFSFENCALTAIDIPASVTSIGNGAFAQCYGLTSVSFASPSSLTTIGYSAFISCKSLTSINIPASIISIGNAAFNSCSSLASVSFTSPSSLISIGEEAFQSCTVLTSVSIPALVTTIGNRAFFNSLAIESITVDANNASYSSSDGVLFDKDKSLLIYCPPAKAGSYTIPSTVDTIKNDAFNYCSGLTEIVLPSNLISIGELAFARCSNLTTISLPAAVVSISRRAFFNCSGFTSFYVNRATPADLSSSSGVFVGVDVDNCILYVPTGSKSEYASANQWEDFNQIVEMTSTSANQIQIDASYKIYPNPVTDILTIDLGGAFDGSALMTICNAQGTLIMKQQLDLQKTMVDLSKLSTGSYFIEVNSGSKTQSKVLIKR